MIGNTCISKAILQFYNLDFTTELERADEATITRTGAVSKGEQEPRIE